MKFSGREDIDAPIEAVFLRLTDFETHERSIMRRGVNLRRTDGMDRYGIGMTWDARVKFRGKERNLNVELSDWRDPEILCYVIEGAGLAGTFQFDLLALSAMTTRLAVALEMKPKNLTGRLLMQSMRILKPNLNRRFQSKLSDAAELLALSKGGRRR